MKRVLSVVTNVPGRPGLGYEIVDERISPSEVTVVGPRNLVMGLDHVRTYPIDVSSAEGDITMDVELRFPPHPAFLEERTVTVTMEIREEFVQRSFLSVPVVLEPIFSGLPSGAIDGEYHAQRPSAGAGPSRSQGFEIRGCP